MSEAPHAPLPVRRLGRSGLHVPAFAMGGAGIGGILDPVAEEEAIATVRHALERGIRYVDTSPLYGESERRIGIALEGIPRESYVLSTKTGTHPDRWQDYSWDGTMASVENSLRLLKTGYVDLLLIHDPEDLEPALAPGGALDALEELKRQGVVRSIGLGVREHAFHRRAIEAGRLDVILTYNDYHPIRTTALTGGLLELAARHDVGVLNGSPLAFGLLNGRNPERAEARVRNRFDAWDLDAAGRFIRWCRERELSPVHVIFQFCLRQPLIHATLTGAKNRRELDENLRAAAIPLPEWVWTELAALRLTDAQV